MAMDFHLVRLAHRDHCHCGLLLHPQSSRHGQIPERQGTFIYSTAPDRGQRCNARRGIQLGQCSQGFYRHQDLPLRFWVSSMSLPLYTLSLFLPSIIRGLAYTAAQAQLITILPYAIAFVTTITTAVLSERHHIRAPFIIGTTSFAIIDSLGTSCCCRTTVLGSPT